MPLVLERKKKQDEKPRGNNVLIPIINTCDIDTYKIYSFQQLFSRYYSYRHMRWKSVSWNQKLISERHLQFTILMPNAQTVPLAKSMYLHSMSCRHFCGTVSIIGKWIAEWSISVWRSKLRLSKGRVSRGRGDGPHACTFTQKVLALTT